MLIEKYLNNIAVPDGHPGPIAVKMKYDIKNRLVQHRKRKEKVHLATSSLSLVMLLFVGLLLYNPDFAFNINDNLSTALSNFSSIRLSSLDKEQLEAERLQAHLPLTDSGNFIGTQTFDPENSTTSSLPGFIPVSSVSETESSYQVMELSQLNEDTPYIIRKVKDENNRYVYIVNQITNETTESKIPY